MPEEQVNPFEISPQQPKPPTPWATLTPQGQGGAEEGYFQQVDPAVMQMMWAPPPQVPPPQPQVPPLPYA